MRAIDYNREMSDKFSALKDKLFNEERTPADDNLCNEAAT